MIGATGELDCFSAHIHLREHDKSEDKAEESMGRKGAKEVENTEANSKYQDRDGRAKANKLHKTGVNGLLIKIAENKGLQVDAGVLDQGTK
ncbi:hypothetical protein BHE74_00019318 [Ensete ventricosum]|nr:hypothetical protein BHE74_00019318 [Ensete ventricosum]